MDFGDAVKGLDVESIGDSLAVRFAVSVDHGDILGWCRAAIDKQIGSFGWKESTWLIWFKNRLSEAGYLSSRADDDALAFRATARLHVWFLYLRESVEMIAFLQAEGKPRESSVARSRLFASLLRELRPIDKTAWRMSPPQMKWGNSK